MPSPKNLALDFIHYLVIIALIIFIFFHIFLGNRFFLLSQFILKSLLPLSLFVLVFLVKLKIDRHEIVKKREEQEMDITLYVTYFDKLLGNILTFILPIIIIIIAILGYKLINTVDIIQASSVFIIVFLWQKYLFKKRG